MSRLFYILFVALCQKILNGKDLLLKNHSVITIIAFHIVDLKLFRNNQSNEKLQQSIYSPYLKHHVIENS